MSESVRCVPITGAPTGIGEVTIRRLCRLGWDTVAVARREERFTALAAGTGCEYAAVDLSDEAAVGALAARVLGDGPVDAPMNNAGGALGMDMIAYANPDRWIAMYHRNVMTALRITRALFSGMCEKGGDFVFLTSTVAHNTCPGGGGCATAKCVERIIANTLRQELVGEPVRIVEITSGMVKTPEFSLNRLGPEEAAVKMYEDVAEPLLADDVADAIYWTLTRPAHVDIDPMILRSVAQTTNILLARQE